ncbi:hypothetical protein B0H13DRAFT_2377859 [Mycena leptocephala]|nr:hypothetical protein B0H13DRAFT_2377859 [Mycena leptocephala]
MSQLPVVTLDLLHTEHMYGVDLHILDDTLGLQEAPAILREYFHQAEDIKNGRDVRALARAAQFFKSSSTSLGIKRVQEICARLEDSNALTAIDVAELKAIVDDMWQEYAVAHKLLTHT